MDNNIVQQELAATAESQKLAIYKSIYYQMNAKPDSLSKAYARKVIINKDDLIDLNNRINDRIRLNYEQDGYIASVTVNLKDKHVITFKCWEEFLQHKWIENSSTVSIVLQWNFNIRVPGYEQPQNHNLVVKLTNGLRPEEMLNLIFSGKIEDFEEVELNTFPPNVTLVLFLFKFNFTPGAILKLFLNLKDILKPSFFNHILNNSRTKYSILNCSKAIKVLSTEYL